MGLSTITTKVLKNGTFTDENLGELRYEITQNASSFNFIPMFPIGRKKTTILNKTGDVTDIKKLSEKS